ncbi:MAG TPA: hypothetical protein VGI63_10265 [Verrucomicrobiae bacterium]|jgi:hypothetical protein
MSGNPELNGPDYLMLGFDHELRRHGFAGNSCQMALELGAAISPGALRQRLAVLINSHPILRARPGGIIFPKWKMARAAIVYPQVRVHRHDPGLLQTLFNEPLAMRRGELLRFDLIERDGGRMTLIFTWAHALLDAPGAEQFLAVIGNEELSLPALGLPPPVRARLCLRERLRLAWKYLHHIDRLGKTAPRSIGIRNPAAPANLRYRVEKFSSEETARIRAHGRRLAGVLGDAQFHAAVAMVELSRLHQRLGIPTPSYVLPVSVGLRPKGALAPLFGNQITMLMLQFLPDQLDSVASAVTSLKTQTAQALRTGLLESGVVLGEMFRFLPLPVYMGILKQGLRGEICSLFYGNTAAVNPHLEIFLGVAVEDFTHVAPVTPAPGIGVIFYYFRGGLRVTVLHSLKVLNEIEAAEFSARLRARLLNP